MGKKTAAALVTAVAAAAVVIVPSAPASAAVTLSANSTNLSVNVTGNETISFSCVGGTVRVNGAASSPTVACNALAQIAVTGDGGQQIVNGHQLTKAAFPSLTAGAITTGGGSDTISPTPASDTINAGDGTDAVLLDITTSTDTAIDLGNDADDQLFVSGTPGNDTVSVSSTGTNGNLTTKVGAATAIGRSYSGVKSWVIHGGAGNDDLSTASLFVAALVTLDGGEGDDKLTSGTGTADLVGGPGTNTYVGGQAVDFIRTTSETDIINGGSANNTFLDAGSLRSGGRTITVAGGASDTYQVDLKRNDAVWRVRRGAVQGDTDTVASLHRPGKQLLPSSVDIVRGEFADVSEPADHTIADVHSLYGTDVVVNDGTKKSTVVDVTIGSGSWTTSGTIGNGTGTITPNAFGYSPILLQNVGPVSVHGPWTNKNRGFAHRATRDLVFRFPTSAQLDAAQGALGAGSLTRPQFTSNLMDTDEYRGLDVDRVFVEYLRRAADPGGRAYWINSLDDGKALWRFRAQLFGSNEYFTKAGGTNASYVMKAYNDVLGRNPDPSGQAYWTNKLNGGADRGAVALQFINSPEARRRLVDDQFLRFLDRKPTASEQTTWVDALPGASGELDLISYLVNSGAYFDRT